MSLNDYSDVHAVMGVLTNSTGDSDYLSQLEAVADVDQWLTWFGIMALLANSESNLSGGHDSDYASYTGINDPRLKLIPHDLDSILFESSYDPASHTLFDMVEDDDIIEILVPLFDLPEIRQRYYQTLRRLLDTTFSKSYFDHLVAFTWADWVPAETQQITIDWMDTRRAYATGAVNLALGPHPGILHHKH